MKHFGFPSSNTTFMDHSPMLMTHMGIFLAQTKAINNKVNHHSTCGLVGGLEHEFYFSIYWE
jgi:hypothetical protein